MLKAIFNVNKLNGKVAELEAQNAEWNNKYTQLDAAYNELKNANEQFLTEKAQMEADIDKLKADHAAEIVSLKQANELKKEEVASQAAEIVASIGVNQEVLPVFELNTLTPEQIYNKWQSLKKTDAQEAAAFYKEHRDTLISYTGFRIK
jgi:predicted nuclease with TOPRIM domain